MIYLNGEVVATDDQLKSITQEEYDAIPESDKRDNITYFVTDTNDLEYEKIVNLEFGMGNIDNISTYADGTLAGAIADIYQRLGGLSFSMGSDGNVVAVHDENEPTKPSTLDLDRITNEDRIKYMEKYMGDLEEMSSSSGYSNISQAIVDIYRRLGGLSFGYTDGRVIGYPNDSVTSQSE